MKVEKKRRRGRVVKRNSFTGYEYLHRVVICSAMAVYFDCKRVFS